MNTVQIRRPPRLLVLAFGVAFAIALLSTTIWTILGLPHANLVSYIMQLLVGTFSVICTAEAARLLHGRQRLAWTFVSIAFAFACVSTVDGLVHIVHGLAIVPIDIAALFQEAALPFAYVGIMLFVGSFLRIGRVRTMLDSFIAVIGVICLAWVLGLADLWAASHQEPVSKLFTIFFPMVDVLYFAPLLFLTLMVPRRHKSSLGVFSLSLLAAVVPDMHYAVMCALGQPYHGGYPVEIGWVLVYSFVAFAGLKVRPITAEDLVPRRSSVWRNGLPYLAVGLCGAAIAFQEIVHGRIDAIMVWGLALLSLLLSVRQILELRENQSLSEALRLQSLRRAEERFASLVENSSDVILVVDHDLLIRYASGAVRTLIGVTPEELQGKTLEAIIQSDDIPEVISHLTDITNGETPHRLEFRVSTPSSDWRYLEALPSNLFGDVNVNGIVLNTRDVTERRELEIKLRRDAAHDPLTGLSNRKSLVDHLEHALAVARRRKGMVGLLFIDLDGFKGINDSAGHVVGDQVLRVVADRLQSCVRASDSVARYGGDEFAVVIDDCASVDGPYILANKIRDVIREPIVFRGFRRVIGASIGIALSVKDDDVTKLVTRADSIMYEAKHGGTGVEIDPLYKLNDRRQAGEMELTERAV